MRKDLTNEIGYVYKITSPNGKIYIGQTINKKQRKHHYNCGSFKQQVKLWNSCEFYKWNPVDTFEIIEECICGPNKINLNEREIHWIKFYDSFKNGLNCNEGGHGNLGNIPSEETRDRMRLAQLGLKHSDERNKKKSEYTKGRIHSEEAKRKMSEVKKLRMNEEVKDKISKGLVGNKNGIGNKGSRRKVYCFNNDKTYESIKEAALELGLHDTGIINVCKGKFSQTKSYKFRYV